MKKHLEKIFNECLARVEWGESIESCLSSYPEEAAELEPLLRTFLNVRWRGSMIEPRPEFKAMTHARLQRVCVPARQQPQRSGFFSLHRVLAPALTAVICIIFVSAGTVAASSDAMPDEALYTVKKATEDVRLALAFSDTGKANLHVQLAETRSEEIVVMAAQGKTEEVVTLTDKLYTHMEEAERAIVRVEEAKTQQVFTTPRAVEAPKALPAPQPDENRAGETTPEPGKDEPKVTPEPGKDETKMTPEPEKTTVPEAEVLRKSLEASISRNLVVLEDALDQSPKEVKPALRRAIELSKKSRQEALRKIKTKGEVKPAPVQPREIRDSGNKSENGEGPTTRKNNDTGLQGTEDRDKDDDDEEGEDKVNLTPVKPGTVQDSSDSSKISDNSTDSSSRNGISTNELESR